ncbi:MAG: hypothetical protein ACD_45C00509G0002 [uncultured bacterium]|nr:MAG: hypothetical protein ACD_45C00509G0002 [uncultured bacterium]OGT55206.1 MAG: hypothetical protein A3F43_04690 [Gammaproteobacteria bacterium RIFCSPHIGHO2_12_FULL_42_10]
MRNIDRYTLLLPEDASHCYAITLKCNKYSVLATCLAGLILCMSLHAKTAPAETLDQVVVIVNDDIITQSEFNHALHLINQEIAQSQSAAPPNDVLQKQVLDQLINKKLQLQLAKMAGLTINNQELNRIIAHIAEQNHVTTASLYDHLSQDGITPLEYRDAIHEQMLIQKIQQQEVANKINTTPQEVDDFIHTHPELKQQAAATRKQRAESLLLQQKFEEAVSTWISKIRGQAYIAIK